MMNVKQILIGLGIAILVGGGAFMLLGGDDSTVDVGGVTSLNELLARGENLTCNYDYTDEEGSRSYGTSYIDGKRMAGTFYVQVSGEGTLTSQVINDGKFTYVWEEGSDSGFKAAITEEEAAEIDADDQQAIDQDEDYEFDCSRWSVDESKFVPPTDVSFIDLDAQIQEAADEIDQTIEEACAEITEAAAREACENILN